MNTTMVNNSSATAAVGGPLDLDADKAEIQKQWNGSPCAAESVVGLAIGSKDYYAAIRRFRYEVYAPWLEEQAGFARWRDRSILEIGVGLGSDHCRFAANGNRMTALDLSEAHLRHTGHHLQLEGLQTEPVLGDAEHMPFPDASFDAVYSFGVLHHTPNTEAAVGEVHRVLRPGGTAMVSLYHRDSVAYWFHTMFVQGVLKAKLLRMGRRRMLSEIEYRNDQTSALPLVKVYSRAQVRRLFASFRAVEVSAHHIEASHIWSRLESLFPNRQRWERWFGWAGWYLMIHATK